MQYSDTHRTADRGVNTPTGETNVQLAELTCAALYSLARHALSTESPPMEPSTDDSTRPVGVKTLAAETLSSSAEGTLSAFAAQIGSELQDSSQGTGHGDSGYGALCAAMAAEACVAAAARALAAGAAGTAHRNPFHEILAGAREHRSLVSSISGCSSLWSVSARQPVTNH